MGELTADVKKNISIAETVIRSVAFGFKNYPVLLSVCAFTSMCNSVSYVFITWTSQRLFDSIADLAAGNEIYPVIYAILLMGLSYIGCQVASGLDSLFFLYIHRKVIGKLYEKFHDKAQRIAPICYEKPEHLDMIEKARSSIMPTADTSFSWLNIISYFTSYFIALGFVLHAISPVLVIALFIAFIPTIISQWLRLNIFSHLEDECAPIRRKMSSYEEAICGKSCFKETRALGAYHYLNRKYMNTVSELNQKQWQSEKQSNIMLLISRIITALGYMAVIILLIYLLVMKSITVGGFAAVFSSLYMMFSMAENFFGSELGLLAQNAAKAQNLFRFFELEESGGSSGNYDYNSGIELQNVHFTYPNAKKEALHAVNIKLAPGETMAIVGENGAGKSTLAKLIMGIYRPDTGTVMTGGLSTGKTDPAVIYRHCTAVFQKFIKYQMTLSENVMISDSEGFSQECDGKIKAALRAADLDIGKETFPGGLQTMLSREFDGIDLSGGQWQRLAIARGLYRIHDIIVLDEPTASIDPLEEYRLYEKFASISKNKIALIVTHRLGAVKLADKIIVLDNGEIKESGTHQELMSSGGLYARMYHAQQEWYDFKPTMME